MLTTINKINNFLTSKAMMVFDYLGAAGLLGYAYYKHTLGEDFTLWAVVGGISLVLAILRPAHRIQKKTNDKNKQK